MPSLVAKKKGNKLYYYVVESARVEGKPRIVHQVYLGTAEKLAELVRAAAALPKARRATRPTRGSQQRRLAAKRHRSGVKAARRPTGPRHPGPTGPRRAGRPPVRCRPCPR